MATRDGQGSTCGPSGGVTALAGEISTFHEPIVVAEAGTNSPGQEPDITIIGSTMVAEFTLNTDKAYRVFKIPSSYVGNPSFHVHWTKESGVAGNGNESGNAVLWRINYTVFAGGPLAGGQGHDINVTPSTVEFEDTYDDSGTTTRIIERTPNLGLVGFVAGYYVGMEVEAITPAGAALTCEPALVTVDLTFDQYINQ